MKISYTYVAIDIFHYGHLKLLESAKSKADLHICGLLSDEVCINWNGNLIMNYDERFGILNSLNCVDEVIEQSSIDPTHNLKSIHEQYPDAEIILFQGHQEWKNMPGTEYIKLIGGKVIKPEFYPRLTRGFIKSELSRASSKSEFDIERGPPHKQTCRSRPSAWNVNYYYSSSGSVGTHRNPVGTREQ